MNVVFWKRRAGGVWPSAGVAISACKAIKFTEHNVPSPSSGRSLAKYGSTNMTKLHEKPGCLQDLASLAGTMDKPLWPVRLLAKSPPILPSNYREDAG